MNPLTPHHSEVLFYLTENGHTRIAVKVNGETVWLDEGFSGTGQLKTNAVQTIIFKSATSFRTV